MSAALGFTIPVDALKSCTALGLARCKPGSMPWRLADELRILVLDEVRP